jgi:hypothetical protein
VTSAPPPTIKSFAAAAVRLVVLTGVAIEGDQNAENAMRAVKTNMLLNFGNTTAVFA